ncbi:MAG TPA: lysophospholipid acyltransferase family protein [Pseudonocardia sp.]|nr:lysophospholipid acyltransferase family protein [Pseudonocardia sp.]
MIETPVRLHPSLPPTSQSTGHAWEPYSPCTPNCLPDQDTLPRVGRVRVVIRLSALIAAMGFVALGSAMSSLTGVRARDALLRISFRAVLRGIGVRIVHRGPARFSTDDGNGVLVVANHLSWLDILALGSIEPMRMIAKREIRDWPVLGKVATRFGTLFIDRGGLRALPEVVADAAASLRAGSAVGLFPEGTTWCGAASGEFRRAGFQAALDAGVPVRPIAQRMLLPDGTVTTLGAFIGEDTLMDSLLRVLRLPELVVDVQVLAPLVARPGEDRRALARRAELAIAEATGVPAAPARRVPSAPTPHRVAVPDAA